MSPLARLMSGLRWTAIAGVFFGTAEVFSRLDDWVTWDAPLLSPYNHDRLLLRDSLGTRGRPGYRYEKWRMNNAGFRGTDVAPAPAPGTVRVAVLGASETFGLYESEGREYPARMQALLDSIAPGRFDVVNVGLPGLSLASMVPYYRQVVAPVQPRYVFIYPSPSFYLEVTPLPPVYTPPKGTSVTNGAGAGPLGLEPGFFESRLAVKGREVLKELVPPVLVTAFRAWRLERTLEAHGPEWVWQSVPADRMALLEQHLERLIPTIQASGATPVLVTHTNRFTGLSPDGIRRDRRHLVNLRANYYPRASEQVLITVDSAANAVIRRVAAGHGAPVVEVEGQVPVGGGNFGDYAHFTDAGADAMARLLVAGLLRLEPANGRPVGVPHPPTPSR